MNRYETHQRVKYLEWKIRMHIWLLAILTVWFLLSIHLIKKAQSETWYEKLTKQSPIPASGMKLYWKEGDVSWETWSEDSTETNGHWMKKYHTNSSYTPPVARLVWRETNSWVPQYEFDYMTNSPTEGSGSNTTPRPSQE